MVGDLEIVGAAQAFEDGAAGEAAAGGGRRRGDEDGEVGELGGEGFEAGGRDREAFVLGAHIPAHVDPAQHGKRPRRINAVVIEASGGGDLGIDGTLIELSGGDAVVFYPDAEIREVAPVAGTRVLFSVGALLTAA